MEDTLKKKNSFWMQRIGIVNTKVLFNYNKIFHQNYMMRTQYMTIKESGKFSKYSFLIKRVTATVVN